MEKFADLKNKLINNKKLVIIAVVIVLALVCVLFLVSSNNSRSLNNCLDLGDKYLEEMEYEKALAAYNEAIEIDDRCTEAYLGLVEVYIRTEEFDKALEVAKQGYEKTGDDRLKEKLDMIESGNIYDSNGQAYRMTHFDADGKATWYHDYSYNEDGEMSSVTHKNSDGTIISSIELKYDSEGHPLISYGYVNDTGMLIKYENTYDNDNLISSVETDMDGSVTRVNEYIYEDNKCVKQKIISKYTYDGGTTENISYYLNEYDSQGNQIKRTYCNEDMSITGYDTFEYDTEGNMIKQFMYFKSDDSDEIVLRSYNINIYDSNGNFLGTESYDGDGNLQYSDVRTNE